jgi:hypothetical protein
VTTVTAPRDDGIERQFSEVRRQLAEAEELVGTDDVVGTAGDGAVRVGVRGEFSFNSVTIDPRVVDPSETELLEDLILAALRDAVARLADRRRAALGAALGGILGGILGGAEAPRPDPGPPAVE